MDEEEIDLKKQKKQFLIFCICVSIFSILVYIVFVPKPVQYDNVQNFKITNSVITKYLGEDTNVELPYVYKLDNKGNAVFGYQCYVRVLDANAFVENNGITRLAISINITQINDDAFNNLTDLEYIVFRGEMPPQISVTEFDKLTSLKNIYVYKSNLQNYLNDAVFQTLQDKIKTV